MSNLKKIIPKGKLNFEDCIYLRKINKNKQVIIKPLKE